MIDLYEATLQTRHLEFALALGHALLAKFYDPEHGGFWESTAGARDLIFRVKEDYDGAEPSGNGAEPSGNGAASASAADESADDESADDESPPEYPRRIL